jgi:hypothetical protein
MTNIELAEAIRAIHKLREASYVGAGRYGKRYDECIAEVVGSDPIHLLLSCLFTAGYCEMFDFCDIVLGAEPSHNAKTELGADPFRKA